MKQGFADLLNDIGINKRIFMDEDQQSDQDQEMDCEEEGEEE